MDSAIAVTGAFLLVAYADGRYEPSEESRFLSTIANDPALEPFKTEALELAYNLLNKEFIAGYAETSERVLTRVAALKNDARVADAVKLAARSAVVADRRIAPQEELALSRLAAALGLPEGEL